LNTIEQLKIIPKVELHRHLDGSVRFDTICELAKKNNIDLGIDLSDRQSLWEKVKILKPMSGLQEVLDSFWATQKVMSNYDAIKRVAFENVEDCFNDGVKLAELRFAPTFIGLNKEISFQDIIQAVIDGVNEGVDKFGIEVGLILIAARSLDVNDNLKALKDARTLIQSNYKGIDRLIGFDLADTENDHNPKQFIELINFAKDLGLEITIHSGEDTTADHVINSIKLFEPKRIGHGIKVWNNQFALDLIKEKNIHLEVCPTSNWLTRCVDSLSNHPFNELYKCGISVSINSDDPHIMNINLINEYEVLSKEFRLTLSDFKKINKDSVNYSFLSSEIKNKINNLYFSK